ncbi:Hypothetical protein NTJ_05214 [Nesidiocoris tenuis]|uniref:Uncharacterized protein n=1 Tax=Nesidiocoris tenuis TaxID=355587 RepID=A0ABN7AJH5_9HEMI|nr:Hypothetical protein NTJ_05214 [Nesidiocoris tenuis]
MDPQTNFRETGAVNTQRNLRPAVLFALTRDESHPRFLICEVTAIWMRLITERNRVPLRDPGPTPRPPVLAVISDSGKTVGRRS